MGAAATRVSLTASGRSQTIEGVVRITASEAASAFVLPPIVARLRRAEPGIVVEIVASNGIRDLRRREADIAVRSVRPTDPDLIARKLRDGSARLYAADSYLARIGGLSAPQDMTRAEFIGFDENDSFLEGLNAVGVGLTARNFPVLSANHLVHWELVKQGVGVGVMITEVGDAEPRVRRAAPWLEPWVYPVWLVAHRELNTSRRVRLVFDRLTEELTAR